VRSKYSPHEMDRNKFLDYDIEGRSKWEEGTLREVSCVFHRLINFSSLYRADISVPIVSFLFNEQYA
jgi:hypothetical protein